MMKPASRIAALLLLIAWGLAGLWPAAAQDSGPYVEHMQLGRGMLRSVAWSPDGELIAVGGALGIWLYDADLTLRGRLTGHTKAVYDLAFSPDGARLASVSHDLTVRIWDVTTQAELRQMAGHSGLVVAVDWSPDGRTVASGAYDDTLRLWDPDTGDLRAVLDGPAGGVNDVAYSPNGAILASANGDSTVWLWDTITNRSYPASTLPAGTGRVGAVAWGPDGALIAAGWDGRVHYIGGPVSQAASWPFEAHPDVIYDMAFSPPGVTFATASWDGSVRIWHKFDLAQVRELRAADLPGRVHHLAWSPDGKRLAAVSWDDTLRVWDVTGAQPPRILYEHTDWITGLKWSDDGSQIISSSGDGWLRIWNTADGTLLDARPDTLEAGPRVAVSPDGTRQAEARSDGTTITDTATGEEIAVLPGAANAVSWSPDGARLAVALRNGIIKIWGHE